MCPDRLGGMPNPVESQGGPSDARARTFRPTMVAFRHSRFLCTLHIEKWFVSEYCTFPTRWLKLCCFQSKKEPIEYIQAPPPECCGFSGISFSVCVASRNGGVDPGSSPLGGAECT